MECCSYQIREGFGWDQDADEWKAHQNLDFIKRAWFSECVLCAICFEMVCACAVSAECLASARVWNEIVRRHKSARQTRKKDLVSLLLLFTHFFGWSWRLKDYQFLRSRCICKNHQFWRFFRVANVVNGWFFCRIQTSTATNSIPRHIYMLGISVCSMQTAQCMQLNEHHECRCCSCCTQNGIYLEFSARIFQSMRSITASCSKALYMPASSNKFL